MISAVAFCPQAPVLVPEVAQGAAGELADLRTACRAAIRRLVAPGRRLVVLGGGERDEAFGPTARGSLAGFGVELQVSLGSDEPGAEPPAELPPSLAVGAWLLRDALGANSGAVGYSVGEPSTFDGDWHSAQGADVGVLVMGDGSARRSLKAPGYFDERAEAADIRTARALRDGESRRLHRELLDPGDELLISGLCVWDLLSRSLGAAVWNAELLYDAAPYGVGYFVASWTLREPAERG